MTPTVEIITTPVVITPVATATPVVTPATPPVAQSYPIVALESVVIDIVNQATIGSDQTPTQTATITKPVVRVVDPAISKSVDPTRASPGDTVRFYITVNNPAPPNSNANATNIVVVDALPLTVDLVNYTLSSIPSGVISSATVTTNTVSTGHPTITETVAATITVNIPVMAPGEQVFLYIETVVNNLASPPPQTINNSVYMTFNEGGPRADSSPPILVPTPPRPDNGNDDDDDNPPPAVITPPPVPEVQPTLPVFYLPETGLVEVSSTTFSFARSLLLISLFGIGIVVWTARRRDR